MLCAPLATAGRQSSKRADSRGVRRHEALVAIGGAYLPSAHTVPHGVGGQPPNAVTRAGSQRSAAPAGTMGPTSGMEQAALCRQQRSAEKKAREEKREAEQDAEAAKTQATIRATLENLVPQDGSADGSAAAALACYLALMHSAERAERAARAERSERQERAERQERMEDGERVRFSAAVRSVRTEFDCKLVLLACSIDDACALAAADRP